MIKFNDTSILSGCIKQLLHTFNLPTVKIPVEGDWVVKDNYYLYKKNLYKANRTTNNLDSLLESQSIGYIYNKKYSSFTKNLIIENNIYDSYTHKYLGDYLRFQRDYNSLNLMSMYNCFNNEMPKFMNLKMNQEGKVISFNSEDNLYKIYMVPVKFFREYTIAIDSDSTIEIICGFYDKKAYPLSDPDNNYNWWFPYNALLEHTYTKLTGVSFSNPILFNKLKTFNIDFESFPHILECEKDLKLFIKLPVKNNSSIIILEGNYVNNNSYKIEENKKLYNYSVVNYSEYENDLPVENKNIGKIPLINRCQLLDMNCGESHPFADRLIEYLLDNAVTNIETIPDNIKRLQQKLLSRNREGKLGLNNIKYDGIWEDKYRDILYDISVQQGLNQKPDMIGYFDKDIEQYLGQDIDIYGISGTKNGRKK